MNLSFTIDFHGPFRVETGSARHGLDNTIDQTDLIPASSLKGTMRASAQRLLGDHPIIGEIFGGNGDAAGWAWERAKFDGCTVLTKNRIQIDSATHTVVEGHLQRSEAAYAGAASFDIRYVGPSPVPNRHVTVLTASALGVHSLGADRNRGYGWVTITANFPTAPQTRQLAEDILRLRKNESVCQDALASVS